MRERRETPDGVRGTEDATFGRRRLLGRAGTVAAAAGAGVAGAAVVGAPAQAAPGSPVTLGGTNDAGTASTAVSSATPEPTLPTDAWQPTLSLANTTTPDTAGFAGPPLQLQPSGDFVKGPAGSFGVSVGGVPYFVPEQNLVEYMYTSGNSWTTFPIIPSRAVDTRSAPSRTKILNPGALDSSFRLKANNFIAVDLDDYFDGAVVLYGNLTVVTAATGGFVVIYPGGMAQPAVSTVNFVRGQTIANAFVVGLGTDSTGKGSQNAVRIFSSTATHVLLDLTAVGVGAFSQINPSVLPSSVSQSLTARAATPQRLIRTKPKWASG
jgi:hypothetical protein